MWLWDDLPLFRCLHESSQGHGSKEEVFAKVAVEIYCITKYLSDKHLNWDICLQFCSLWRHFRKWISALLGRPVLLSLERRRLRGDLFTNVPCQEGQQRECADLLTLVITNRAWGNWMKLHQMKLVLEIRILHLKNGQSLEQAPQGRHSTKSVRTQEVSG